jgi:AcrR family transcriptional regulator
MVGRTSTTNNTSKRLPLTRERVVQAAVDLCDRHGIAALTMRSLAQSLGVKPMAIYHHVANKDEILDGIVDLVFAEIEQPAVDAPWRPALAARAADARQVLRRHPWAIGVLESRRSPGPATLRHHDTTIGVLVNGGFTHPAIAHAMAFLDAYVYGFVLQEVSLPFDDANSAADLATEVLAQMPAEQYPYFVAFAVDHVLAPGYDFAAEFDIGLAMALDGIAALR